jgi:hypothetical protein
LLAYSISSSSVRFRRGFQFPDFAERFCRGSHFPDLKSLVSSMLGRVTGLNTIKMINSARFAKGFFATSESLKNGRMDSAKTKKHSSK